MSTTPRLVAMAGSLRQDSFNKKLVKIAMAGAQKAGAEVTYVDLRDYPMPVFDEDLERAHGLPEPAKKLKALFAASHGFLFACPEYNSSITAAMKNAIDWVSRATEGDKGMIAFQGKAAVIMAASPGALGGLRGLVTVRSILSNIDVTVLPSQIAINRAFEAFAPDGSLKDPKQQATVEGLGQKLADFVARLHR